MKETKNGESHQIPSVYSGEELLNSYNQIHRKANPLHKLASDNKKEDTKPTNNHPEPTLHQLYHQLHPEKFNK